MEFLPLRPRPFLLDERVPNRFLGIRDFPYLRLGILDYKAKSGRDSGLKVCAGDEIPKIPLGIMGLHEILSRDYGTEDPYWGLSEERARRNGCFHRLPEIVRNSKHHESVVWNQKPSLSRITLHNCEKEKSFCAFLQFTNYFFVA